MLDAALSLADTAGLEAVTMRGVAAALGVEAMSLYRHVADKEALLDGLVERVIAEVAVPSPGRDWRRALRARALSMREVLLRHPWAAMLIESRVSPGPARLRLHEAGLRALRQGGFTVALAYHAYLTLDSYIYGFVLQEVWWPFEPEDRPELIEDLRPAIAPDEHPHMVEVMSFLAKRARRGGGRGAAYLAEFEFGLDLILDGLERARGPRPASST